VNIHSFSSKGDEGIVALSPEVNSVKNFLQLPLSGIFGIIKIEWK